MKITYILIALTSVLAAAAPADDAAEYAATAELASNLPESDMVLSNANNAEAALRPCGGYTPAQCRAACEAAKRGCPGAPERSVRLEGMMFGHWFRNVGRHLYLNSAFTAVSGLFIEGGSTGNCG
ncbi:hypothetical protein FQN55_001240 [Onygenales sp. PD_40]|nr:hypothetical protein FQN55_001240 [Onygenales sp. PD_40]KAK2803247.1 hypothetical protein FQN51_003664 [Onygenales sp. PD_10]